MKILAALLIPLAVCSCSKAPSRFCLGTERSSYLGSGGSKLDISWPSADRPNAKFSFSAPPAPPLSNEINVPIVRNREYILVSNILSIPINSGIENWSVDGMKCSIIPSDASDYIRIYCINAAYNSKTEVEYSKNRGVIAWINIPISGENVGRVSRFNLLSRYGFGYEAKNGACARF